VKRRTLRGLERVFSLYKRLPGRHYRPHKREGLAIGNSSHSNKGAQGIHLPLGRQGQAGKIIRGELRAVSETAVNATLRRQGILVQKARGRRSARRRVTEKDLALFTRQLATMMKAGVPLLQSFDIVGKGASNPAVQKLLLGVKTEVETARRSPRRSAVPAVLRCALLQPRAGGRAGGNSGKPARAPGDLQGEDPWPSSRDQVGAVLPDRDHRGGIHHHRGDHDFVIPAFKEVFRNFGADLAGAHAGRDGDFRLVRDQVVHHLPVIIGGIYGFLQA